MKAPVDYLRPIAGQIREALAPKGVRGGKPCAGALECAGTLCCALREDWQPYMALLLEPMAQTGLSGTRAEGGAAALDLLLQHGGSRGENSDCQPWRWPSGDLPAAFVAEPLVAALRCVVEALPALLPRAQELLLELLSMVLSRRPFLLAAAGSVPSSPAPMPPAEAPLPAQVRLALATLATFDLSPHPLLGFVRDYVLPYLDDNDPAVRRAAALAACHVVELHVHCGGGRPDARLPSSEHRAVDKVWAATAGGLLEVA